MLTKLLDITVSVDNYGYMAVKFNLDRWEDFIAGKFTGENAKGKPTPGWRDLEYVKPSDDAIFIEIRKYPKAAKEKYTAEQIDKRIKVRVLVQTRDLCLIDIVYNR